MDWLNTEMNTFLADFDFQPIDFLKSKKITLFFDMNNISVNIELLEESEQLIVYFIGTIATECRMRVLKNALNLVSIHENAEHLLRVGLLGENCLVFSVLL